MSNIQKQHKISPAIAWLTIQKFIIFYCPLDGEHTKLAGRYFCYFAWLVAFTNSSQKISTHLLTVLIISVILQIEQRGREMMNDLPSEFPGNELAEHI